ncbi:MmcQ/YjbR family DNA-binding protein [Bacteroidia bacterium]|nr:MmcQ/YjbR family DNA-binding protein [Bacteroidia bacterium]
MDIEFFREYCLGMQHVTEDTPFGPNTLVMKVHGKMFALCGIDNFSSVNLKCDPEIAPELRANYIAVESGFHMNKKHWNTVQIGSYVSDKLLIKMIDDSYNLVVDTLPKKLKETIKRD